jgi:hypothetical protein
VMKSSAKMGTKIIIAIWFDLLYIKDGIADISNNLG